jgi:hypothetical protein
MSGGVVQLVATGPQDAWLTGKPEISFFRSNYKRYTHYANSVERQVIQGNPIAGGISTIRFEKKGDLLSYVYLTAKDSNGSSIAQLDWTKVIDKIDLYVGGQIVDTHDIEYMTDIEPVTGAQTFSQRYLNTTSTVFNNQKMSFLPLKFFFCKDWSVCLPLIGLQFHDVELRITWSSFLNQNVNLGGIFATTVTTVAPSISSASIPQSTANVFSVGLLSNTLANVTVTQQTGPIFQGMLMTPQFSSPSFNVYTNAAVVQSFSNISNISTTSNIFLAYSNVANVFSYASNVVSLFAPTVSAQVVGPTNTITGSTSTLILGQISSPTSSSNILPGMYVYGLPVPSGVVTVSSWTPPNVGLNFSVSIPQTITVPLNTTISFLSNVVTTTTTPSTAYTYGGLQYQAWSNFTYLDQGERDWFAKTKQDLLITQVQRVVMGTNPTQELALAQPVKFIAFPCKNYNTLYNLGAGSAAATDYQLKTQVNGIDVGDSRHMTHWIDVPQYYNTPFGYGHNNSTANVAIISYCLDTSKLQPTGTLNFSRLDTYRLVVPASIGSQGLLALAGPVAYPVTYLYAVSYNVFRIENGLGSLLYAN